MTPFQRATMKARRGDLLLPEDFEAMRLASAIPPPHCPCAFFQAGKMGIFEGSGEIGSAGRPNKIATGQFEARCEHFAHGQVVRIVKEKEFCPKSTEVRFVRLAP